MQNSKLISACQEHFINHTDVFPHSQVYTIDSSSDIFVCQQ